MKRIALILTGLFLTLPAFTFAAEGAPSGSNLKVEIKLGTGIENRQVTGEADSFDATTSQIIGWTLIEGANEPVDITHEWLLNGETTSTVPLSVKSSRFRTFSRKSINGRTGSWEFRVKDAGGAVIASKKFEITAAAATPIP